MERRSWREGRHAVKYGFTADTYRYVYIARLEEDMRRSRGGVDRPLRPEMACTMIYLITGQQVSIVSHRDARNGTLETYFTWT